MRTSSVSSASFVLGYAVRAILSINSPPLRGIDGNEGERQIESGS